MFEEVSLTSAFSLNFDLEAFQNMLEASSQEVVASFAAISEQCAAEIADLESKEQNESASVVVVPLDQSPEYQTAFQDGADSAQLAFSLESALSYYLYEGELEEAFRKGFSSVSNSITPSSQITS